MSNTLCISRIRTPWAERRASLESSHESHPRSHPETRALHVYTRMTSPPKKAPKRLKKQTRARNYENHACVKQAKDRVHAHEKLKTGFSMLNLLLPQAHKREKQKSKTETHTQRNKQIQKYKREREREREREMNAPTSGAKPPMFSSKCCSSTTPTST